MDASLVIPRLESFEGRVPYMYRCTGGKVTIGIGHAIETPADALNLPCSIDGRPATRRRKQAAPTNRPGARLPIAIGQPIEPPAAALTLPCSIDGRPATGAKIQADYANVAGGGAAI